MTTGIFERLTEACDGRVEPGTEADAVCGVVPSYVASVGSEAGTAAVLRAADELGLTVVPRGTGSKSHWAAAPRSCDLVLDLSRLDRVVDHASGDMVVEVEAGCRLDVLAETLAKAGQRLAVDIPRYDDDTRRPGTVGGLIATGHAGPLRHSYGSIRDLLLGVTMVRADGLVARSGGRVVKNVAGYDLGKLLTGSFGTLGVITSAILRLHPVPAATAWIGATATGTAAAADWVTALVDGQQLPATVDVDRPGNGTPMTVSASFEGTADGTSTRAERAVEAMAASRSVDGRAGTGDAETATAAEGGRSGVTGGADGFAADGDGPAGSGGTSVIAEEPTWHASLPGSPHGTLVAVSVPPALWARAVDVIVDAAAASGIDVPVRAAAGVGVVHAAASPDAPPQGVASFLTAVRDWARDHDGSAIVVHTPPRLHDHLDLWGPVDDGALDLMRRVKNEFDPRYRLSPGRLVGRL